jgi:hypothetical protein
MRIPVYKKILAIFLIALLIEKSGLRLWYHVHYHEHSSLLAVNKNSSNHNTASFEASCDCVDDFMMPVMGAELFVFSFVPVLPFNQYRPSYNTYIYSHSCFSGLLRAPPFIYS